MKKPAKCFRTAIRWSKTLPNDLQKSCLTAEILPALAVLPGKCRNSVKIRPLIGDGCSDCCGALVRIALPTGANRSTHWGESLHPDTL